MDSICPAEEIYGEDSFEVALLRTVRDNLLSRTPEGQALVTLYYQWSPALVRALQADEQLKDDVRQMVNEVFDVMIKQQIVSRNTNIFIQGGH